MRGSTRRNLVLVALGIAGAISAASVVVRARTELVSPAADLPEREVPSDLTGEERPAGDLFERARRVAPVGDPAGEAMFWLGDREAYFLRPAAEPGLFHLILVECDIP